jgi:hypothetical protein
MGPFVQYQQLDQAGWDEGAPFLGGGQHLLPLDCGKVAAELPDGYSRRCLERDAVTAIRPGIGNRNRAPAKYDLVGIDGNVLPVDPRSVRDWEEHRALLVPTAAESAHPQVGEAGTRREAEHPR